MLSSVRKVKVKNQSLSDLHDVLMGIRSYLGVQAVTRKAVG
jgi:hypothetical protein